MGSEQPGALEDEDDRASPLPPIPMGIERRFDDLNKRLETRDKARDDRDASWRAAQSAEQQKVYDAVFALVGEVSGLRGEVAGVKADVAGVKTDVADVKRIVDRAEGLATITAIKVGRLTTEGDANVEERRNLQREFDELKANIAKDARASQSELLNTEQRLAMSAQKAAEVVAKQVIDEKVDVKVEAGLQKIRLENLGTQLAGAQATVHKMEDAAIRKEDHEIVHRHHWYTIGAKTGLQVVGWLAAGLVFLVIYLLVYGSPFQHASTPVVPAPPVVAPVVQAPPPAPPPPVVSAPAYPKGH